MVQVSSVRNIVITAALVTNSQGVPCAQTDGYFVSMQAAHLEPVVQIILA